MNFPPAEPRFPATSRFSPASGPVAAASSAASLTPSRSVTPPDPCLTWRARSTLSVTPEGSATSDIIESAFAKGRRERVVGTLHREALGRARTLMTSEQLRAFDIAREPASVRLEYGETPFGRACLAARRLTEVGVRCVEVTLDGWDSHVNNHELQGKRVKELDPAFAALINDLARRGQLDRTVVLCGGEFGRTPKINPFGGRDHWPVGYSLVIAGGGLKGGQAVGETDPEGRKEPARPTTIADVHATVLTTLGLSPGRENVSPLGRPIKLSEGKAIGELIA